MAASNKLHLLRNFGIVALIGVIAAATILGLQFRRQSLAEILAVAESANESLARVFANTLWPQFRPLAKLSESQSAADLKANPDVPRLHELVVASMRGMQVYKLKVYNARGLTVFSTEAKQIGDDKSGNAGFRAAAAGRTVSELSHRDSFSPFDREVVKDRDLLSSYVPIREGEAVVAVLEIYADVTPFLADANRRAVEAAAIAVGVLALLYAVMFAVVRRADRLIRRQQAESERFQEELAHVALTDPISGLPNRGRLMQHVGEAMARSEPVRGSVAVAVLDLANLKSVNERYGEAVGDAMLAAAGERLHEAFARRGMVARYGSARFALVIESLRNANDAFAQAREVLRLFEAPVQAGERLVPAEWAIGLSLYPKDARTPEQLVRNAVTASHRAMMIGPGHIRFHTVEAPKPAAETEFAGAAADASAEETLLA